MTVSKSKPVLTGSVQLTKARTGNAEGRQLHILSCGEDCHVCIGEGKDKMRGGMDLSVPKDQEDGLAELFEEPIEEIEIAGNFSVTQIVIKMSAQDSILGNDTLSRMESPPTEVTVMFYYTQAFEDITTDIEVWITREKRENHLFLALSPTIPQGFFEHQVEVTNFGYVNSNVDLRIRAFCIEKIENFSERGSPQNVLTSFERRKSNG